MFCSGTWQISCELAKKHKIKSNYFELGTTRIVKFSTREKYSTRGLWALRLWLITVTPAVSMLPCAPNNRHIVLYSARSNVLHLFLLVLTSPKFQLVCSTPSYCRTKGNFETSAQEWRRWYKVKETHYVYQCLRVANFTPFHFALSRFWVNASFRHDHRMIPNWPWTFQGQRPNLCSISIPSSKFNFLSFFSLHNRVSSYMLVCDKCLKWPPKIIFKTLNVPDTFCSRIPGPKFQSLWLYGQIFSSYGPFRDTCNKWPSNHIEHAYKTQRYPMHTARIFWGVTLYFEMSVPNGPNWPLTL